MREAFADELTDGQLKFLYHAEQERERLKKREAQKNAPSQAKF